MSLKRTGGSDAVEYLAGFNFVSCSWVTNPREVFLTVSASGNHSQITGLEDPWSREKAAQAIMD